MKKQQFQSWDEFKPEDWKPSKKEQYCSFSTETLSAYFKFDVDYNATRGEILQTIKYSSEAEQYLTVYNAISRQLISWGLDPGRLSWQYIPNRFETKHEFYSELRETLDPQPGMFYKKCEDDENCFVDSKYYILNEGYDIELCWNQYVYSNKAKQITLWNKFIELLKHRIKEPFRVRLSTPDEDEQERENEI